MEITCPTCQHVIAVEPGESKRCPNCSYFVRAPSQRAAVIAGAVPPPGAPRPVLQPLPSADGGVDPVANVAFVASVLFFIPAIPQLVAIVAGLMALLSSRPSKNRAMAVAAIAIGGTTLVAWGFISCMVYVVVTTRMRAVSFPAPVVATEWRKTDELALSMERIQQAIQAYRRDFRRWPGRVEVLCGPYLPADFNLDPALRFRAPADPTTTDTRWIVLISKSVIMDRFGNVLDGPHHLVLRLAGNVELLPVQKLREALADEYGSLFPAPTTEDD